MSAWEAVLRPDDALARRVALLLAIAAMALALAAVALTAWLRLHPCYLCIFQRFLHMLIAAFLATGATTLFLSRRHHRGGNHQPIP